jgi:hypothetical protein
MTGWGDMATWRHGITGDMEWRHGDMATWRDGEMATWRDGDMGDMTTWRHDET